MSNQFDPPPQKSGGGVLKIVLIVCGVLFLACAGMCAVGGYFLKQGAESAGKFFTHQIVLQSVAVQAQLSVSTNDEVKEKMGEVTFDLATFDGAEPTESDFMELAAKFAVKGSKTSGTAHCVGVQKNGNWQVKEITIKLADGSSIMVPPPAADAPPALNFDLGNENDKK